MRYVAKIHVLDVMDQIVVSGYIYDADPLTDPDHVCLEFTHQVAGMGVDEPMAWLLTGLYRALMAEIDPATESVSQGRPMGGPHTISGL